MKYSEEETQGADMAMAKAFLIACIGIIVMLAIIIPVQCNMNSVKVEDAGNGNTITIEQKNN